MISLHPSPLHRASGLTSSGNTRLNSPVTEIKSSGRAENKPKGFAEPTPPTEKYQYGVDWINLVARFPDIQTMKCIVEVVMTRLNDKMPWCDHRPWSNGRKFDTCYTSVGGAKVAFNEEETGEIDCYLSFNGRALRPASLWSIAKVAIALEPYATNCTRFDVYLDDYTGEIGELRPLMKQAFDDGNVSGFRTLHTHETASLGEDYQCSTYLGSRYSSKVTRIYDKDDRVRAETEFKDSAALSVFLGFVRIAKMEAPQDVVEHELTAFLRDIATGGYDFIEKKSKNLDRNVRLKWWNEFLKKVNAAPIKLKREVPRRSFKRSFRFIQRQVVTTLAMFYYTWGTEEFHRHLREWLHQGKERLKGSHLAMMEQAILERYMINEGIFGDPELVPVM